MKEEIIKLQKLMKERGVDAYYVPSGDPHGSEYVNDHYKTSEYLSGLLAENEELLVTCDAAYIWTDGRFFLQAERELAGSGIQLMKMREPGVPDVSGFLKDLIGRCSSGSFVLGFDGNTLPAGRGLAFEKDLACSTVSVKLARDEDLGSIVWGEDRPQIVPSGLWEFPLRYTGRSASEKIALMRKEMSAKGADYLLLSDLTETAWITNLRGSDILYTPVFFSYALIGMNDAYLYLMDGALDNVIKPEKPVPEALTIMNIRKYDDIYTDIASLPQGSRLWIDSSAVNYTLYCGIADKENLIDEMTPASAAKTVKTATEIECTRKAHIKDGAAVTEFIRWVKDQTRDEGTSAHSKLTEISAADHLEKLRRAQDGCFDLSFETISGYGPNGAVIHYAPSEETDLEIRPEGFLLVDSGGQYVDGTTDITRTIAAGPLTDEMKDNYTRVLKGHIALSRAVISPETTHKELDGLTRKALQDAGLDYLHGVSHGVGHVLAVHEGPAGIRKNDEPCGLKAGMIITDEPGVYIAGRYGIRIENELLLKDAGAEYPEGTLICETITCAPYERDAIVVSMLTDEELAWINEYHAWVRDTLTPLLEEDTAAFLAEAAKPLTRNIG